MEIRDCSQGHELGEEIFKKKLFNVISCAPYLKDEKGHGLAYHSAFEKVIFSLNLSFEAFISKESKLTLPPHWKPFFSSGADSRIKQGLKRAREFLNLFRICKYRPFALFLESFNLIELTSLYIALLFSSPPIKLWILLRYPQELLPLKGKLHRFLFKLLKKHNLTLFTDSSLIADSFSKLNLIVLPIPHTELPFTLRGPPKKEVKMWWPGEPRVQKGLKEIQFISHLSQREFSLFLSESTEIYNNNLNIIRVKDALSRKEFLKIFEEVDVILLPYDASCYRASTSGLFVEAVIGNKVPFVKEGTWLAEECKKFNLNELILDWENHSILENIKLNLYNNVLHNKLSLMRKSYLEFHNLETFSKIIKEYTA